MGILSLRRIIGIFIVFLVCFAIGQSEVFANTNTEEITLGKAKTGKLNNSYDKHLYKFVLKDDGVVTLSMVNKTGVYWNGKILNSKNEVHERVSTNSSSLVGGYSKTQVGLAKGTYYLEITGSYQSSYKAIVNFTKSSKFEKEFNNSIETANRITPNNTYKGIINQSYYDQDVFKFTLDKPGNVTLYIKNQAGAYWSGKIINLKGEVYESLSSSSNSLTSGYAKAQVGLPKGTYYLVIDGSYYSVGKQYEFKLNYTKSDYYEKEYNDTLAKANLLKLNQTYKGVIRNSYDQDVYKFTVPESGLISLSIKRGSGYYWDGTIQNGSGTKFIDVRTDTDKLGNQVGTKTLKKGTYYFVIKGSYYAQQVPYEFKISRQTTNLKSSQVKVTNNKGKNDTIRVAGVKKGDTVKIYNAKSKGKRLGSKKATGKTVNFSIKQLSKKSGKIYVTITRSGMTESKRVTVSYKGEQSDSLKASQVVITNNKGKSDKIKVSKISKGDTIKVYKASSKGKAIVSRKATGKTVTLSVKQLSKKSGRVYVTITRSGMVESKRTAVSYRAERK